MNKISKQLKFFLDLTQVQAKAAHQLDMCLGGLGFNYFVILYHLSVAPGEKMRRMDLAEKVSLSASGVTRILLPMEKIGLVKKEEDPSDARVSFVKIAPGGKRMLNDAIENAQYLAQKMLPTTKLGKVNDITQIFSLVSLGQPL